MPGVVPISEIDKAVTESVARAINGLVALKKLGLQVQLPKEIQITMSVSRDAGINAIPRVRTTGASERKSISKDDGSTQTSKKAATITKTTTVQGPQQDDETQTQVTDSNENNVNAMGRSTVTKIYYEQTT